MAFLSILQVASSDRRLRERVAGRVAQLSDHPARLAREVGLALLRARNSLTHAASASEGPLRGSAASARIEQVVALEGGRTAPTTHRDDGVSVITVLALGSERLTPTAPIGSRPALEVALQTLGAAADRTVDRLAVVLSPAAEASFGPASLSAGYPHMVALGTGPAAGQTRCRYCGTIVDAYRTSCPNCGGGAER